MSTGSFTRIKNTVDTMPELEVASLGQSGVVVQSGVIYTRNTSTIANIITREIADIDLSGSQIMPQRFWNTLIASGGTYQTHIALTLTGANGAKSISMSAKDMGSNGESLSGVIIYDTLAPVIVATNTMSGSRRTLGYSRLEGTISDITPSSLMINGRAATQSGGTWGTDILIQMGNNTYNYVAQDLLGNTSTGTWQIEGYQVVVTAGPGGGGGGSLSTMTSGDSQSHGGSPSTQTLVPSILSLLYPDKKIPNTTPIQDPAPQKIIKTLADIRDLVHQGDDAIFRALVAYRDSATLTRDKRILWQKAILSTIRRELQSLKDGDRRNFLIEKKRELSKWRI
jgi:ABC-type molybdenum transport system ATPase subunit/photorepair protein PhrA